MSKITNDCLTRLAQDGL